MSERVWHYTVGQHLPSIIADGEIKLATEFVWEGKPVVWFSTNPLWEQTANKGWINPDGTRSALSKKETDERCGGLARIEVCPEAAPYNWNDFVRISDTSAKIVRGLARAAKEAGSSTALWRVSFEPVKRENWLAVEVWKNQQWVSLALAVAATNGRPEIGIGT